jgi:DNA-binding response OmpR family regulator
MDYEPSNILLVEDEEAHAELTSRAIRKAGNANRIDILTDGEEALDYVFNRGKYADKTNVIMLTTSDREEDICRSYSHYANSYLTKPVGFKEFEEKIMQIDSYWMLLNKPPVLEA